MGSFLKSGEFAALCGTTKETLRHYEKIGLLPPAYITDSGYRMYDPSQSINFLIATTLKAAGFSLDEIKQYVYARDIREIEGLFRRKDS